MTPGFPLTAIVGQSDLVEALLVNAVAPEVGGLLVRGERGTAKSTAVRALAPLMPPVRVAEGGVFTFAPGDRAPEGVVPADAPAAERRPPLVELPLGATLDRLVGSLDFGRALAGEHAFEAGILAAAHRGVLYVDEVNLLPDHLVDALLDAAASGVVRVERDAVSVQHDARFVLVGTMNAEEGELRPQLLDRFGLGVEVRAPEDPSTRTKIVRRRLEFERAPDAFCERFAGGEAALADRIAVAREHLDGVVIPELELLRISAACVRLEIDGVRGDITCARAARALAALGGCGEVGEQHVRRAAALALAHRRRRDPLAPSGDAGQELARALDEPHDDGPREPPRGGSRRRDGNGAGAGGRETSAPEPQPAAFARERCDPPASARIPAAALSLVEPGRGPSGRSARAAGPAAGSIDSRPARAESDDIALVPTLVARLAGGAGRLREHARSGREGVLLCLVVDASGSMGARRRLARVKGAVLDLLRDAYAQRNEVMVLAFRGDGAQLLVPRGAPLEAAAEAVRNLSTGGRTPLAVGLRAAAAELRRATLRDRERRSIAVVLTDGRVQDSRGEARLAAAELGRVAHALHVVDTEEGPVRLGLARELASAGGALVHELIDVDGGRAA
jgi:magnesium chelatase subunit D